MQTKENARTHILMYTILLKQLIKTLNVNGN